MFIDDFIDNQNIDWNNGFYAISKSELKDIIEKASIIQYSRGKIHGLCHNCEHLGEELIIGEKLAEEICGNLSQCKSCTKLEYVERCKERFCNA